MKITDRMTDFSKAILQDRYLLKGETIEGLAERVANFYSNDEEQIS